MAWSFVQEQMQLAGVDNAWQESVAILVKEWRAYLRVGGQDIIADHQGHQAIIGQRTQDSNIHVLKHQVDNMVTEYKGNIKFDTQNQHTWRENSRKLIF